MLGPEAGQRILQSTSWRASPKERQDFFGAYCSRSALLWIVTDINSVTNRRHDTGKYAQLVLSRHRPRYVHAIISASRSDASGPAS